LAAQAVVAVAAAQEHKAEPLLLVHLALLVEAAVTAEPEPAVVERQALQRVVLVVAAVAAWVKTLATVLGGLGQLVAAAAVAKILLPMCQTAVSEFMVLRAVAGELLKARALLEAVETTDLLAPPQLQTQAVEGAAA
jgi:hypothetical protein